MNVRLSRRWVIHVPLAINGHEQQQGGLGSLPILADHPEQTLTKARWIGRLLLAAALDGFGRTLVEGQVPY